MPKLYLAPAEIRAVLDLITQADTRDSRLLTAADKLHEALDDARTRRENRQLKQHIAASLRQDAAHELYAGWHDIDLDQPDNHPEADTSRLCKNGHNKHFTRCTCDD